MTTRRWIADDGSLIHGKYKGYPVDSVARERPDYLHWCLETIEDMDPECERVMRALLERRGD